MHRRIDTALRQLRQDPCQYLDRSVVERTCRDAGHVWRDGVLTPFATLHRFLLQDLSGDTALKNGSRRGCTCEGNPESRQALPS